jgi:signal transduction histidine kinase
MKTARDMQILIVDDEASIRSVLVQVMQEDGYATLEAGDGKTAWERFRQRPVALVISDIVMPGLNGIELLQRIKAHSPSTQVIMITSHASLRTAVEALRSGAYDYLVKPFEDVNLVSAAVTRAVEKIRLESANRMLIAKLRRHNDELEQRVRRRTADLERINTQLVAEIQERVRAQEAAETANRAKSEFLANMSHELRTPLNHITGFTEILLSQHFGPLVESQQEYLEDVLYSSRHLLSLINDLLDVSKIEAGRMEMTFVPVDLQQLLRSSLRAFHRQAAEKNLALGLDLDGINGRIRADEGKLKQILYNLVSNAIKFTPSGGSVQLRARRLTGGAGEDAIRSKHPKILAGSDGQPDLAEAVPLVWIAVSDTGIGILPEDQERIFDRFIQVDQQRHPKTPGSGLGLSLTKSLVEKHRGRIWVESDGAERGSTFHFVLPV